MDTFHRRLHGGTSDLTIGEGWRYVFSCHLPVQLWLFSVVKLHSPLKIDHDYAVITMVSLAAISNVPHIMMWRPFKGYNGAIICKT